MAEVIFYEKPGCINNTRQKKLLLNAGHTVIEKSLLTEDWVSKKEYLRSFFGTLPVFEWFNKSAPAIKQQQVDPTQLSETQAIDFMVKDPLLIRRPLMQIGGEQQVGFDEAKINAWLAIDLPETSGNLETCPKTNTVSQCQHE